MKNIEEYEEEDYESDRKKDLLAKGELKHCPFCGADPIHLTLESDDGGAFIYCATCDMIVGHAYPGMSIEELIVHWNRRAEE